MTYDFLQNAKAILSETLPSYFYVNELLILTIPL